MGRGQKKSELGRGEAFFCPRPTFRALSHLSRFDSRRSPRGKEETTRSLNLRIFCAKKQEKDRQMKSFELSETSFKDTTTSANTRRVSKKSVRSIRSERKVRLSYKRNNNLWSVRI